MCSTGGLEEVRLGASPYPSAVVAVYAIRDYARARTFHIPAPAGPQA
jgi:hypothetical protein